MEEEVWKVNRGAQSRVQYKGSLANYRRDFFGYRFVCGMEQALKTRRARPTAGFQLHEAFKNLFLCGTVGNWVTKTLKRSTHHARHESALMLHSSGP